MSYHHLSPKSTPSGTGGSRPGRIHSVDGELAAAPRCWPALAVDAMPSSRHRMCRTGHVRIVRSSSRGVLFIIGEDRRALGTRYRGTSSACEEVRRTKVSVAARVTGFRSRSRQRDLEARASGFSRVELDLPRSAEPPRTVLPSCLSRERRVWDMGDVQYHVDVPLPRRSKRRS